MSILQLVFSVVVAFFTLLPALALLVVKPALAGNAVVKSMGQDLNPAIDLLAYTGLVLAAFALVSLISSARKVDRIAPPAWMRSRMTWIYGLIALLPALLLIGWQTFNQRAMADRLMPLFTVLGISASALFLLRLGIGSLWGKSPQRSSGLFTLSLGFTTPLIMIVEVIAMGLLMLGFVSSVAMNPELQKIMQDLPGLLETLQSDPQAAENLLKPLIANPSVIFIVILTFAVIMPLIEELLKTFGVQLLKGRGLSPADGMVAGMMSGAGFGLLEGLLFGLQAMPGIEPEKWAGFLLGRSAALLLHIFTGALNGWALVHSWQGRKTFRLIAAFLLTLVMHGAWNYLAVAGGLQLLDTNLATYLLVGLFLALFVAYNLFTRSVQNSAKGEASRYGA